MYRSDSTYPINIHALKINLLKDLHRTVKNPTEKKYNFYTKKKETAKCFTNSKIQSPKKDFSKPVRELYKKLIIYFRHGFQPQIVNTV